MSDVDPLKYEALEIVRPTVGIEIPESELEEARTEAHNQVQGFNPDKRIGEPKLTGLTRITGQSTTFRFVVPVFNPLAVSGGVQDAPTVPGDSKAKPKRR